MVLCRVYEENVVYNPGVFVCRVSTWWNITASYVEMKKQNEEEAKKNGNEKIWKIKSVLWKRKVIEKKGKFLNSRSFRERIKYTVYVSMIKWFMRMFQIWMLKVLNTIINYFLYCFPFLRFFFLTSLCYFALNIFFFHSRFTLNHCPGINFTNLLFSKRVCVCVHLCGLDSICGMRVCNLRLFVDFIHCACCCKSSHKRTVEK